MLFESLPLLSRPLWASRQLQFIVKQTRFTHPLIEQTINVARDPLAWMLAKDLFSNLRRNTLALIDIRLPTKNQWQMRKVFGIAELVAKASYNASGPGDPFDPEAGWWIAVGIRKYVDEVGDIRLVDLAWTSLCEEDD